MNKASNLNDVIHTPLSLVIFTCEGREHLLFNAYKSFKEACDYTFSKTIMAIDGEIDRAVIDYIRPNVVVQSPVRNGYVNNIMQVLHNINTDYFFWLEDDWKFNNSINLVPFIDQLNSNKNWVQVAYSKTGPLIDELKQYPQAPDFYKNIFGFSANPCICKTTLVKEAFDNLLLAAKGDRLGEDGFENFLTRYFDQQSLISVIHDPIDHTIISHEGYLESTPRNWHMTNSLESKTKNHLLTMPAPSVARKLLMIWKLFKTFLILSVKQLSDNKVYELCFRIMSSAMTIKKDE